MYPTQRSLTGPQVVEPEYDENGVDIALIRHLLTLTPQDRLRRNHRLCREYTELFRQACRDGAAAAAAHRADEVRPLAWPLCDTIRERW